MSKITDWLTEEENPAIRYRTMIEIMDRKPDDYRDCYAKIWEHKKIVKMLSKQDENGVWGINDIRDNSSIYILTVFAEYGLRMDERLDRYAEYIIKLLRNWKEEDIDVFSCYAPLSLRALIMLGYHNRSDVLQLISEFAATQHYDGGFMCSWKLSKKPMRKSCYKAAISGLLLYAECKRKDIPPANADNLINYFINRDVFYSSDRSKVFFYDKGPVKGFPNDLMKMGIPLIMSALSILGAGNHPDLQKAWGMMKEKENENGRFRLEGAAKSPGVFGKDGQENKWATFYALLAEKYRTV